MEVGVGVASDLLRCEGMHFQMVASCRLPSSLGRGAEFMIKGVCFGVSLVWVESQPCHLLAMTLRKVPVPSELVCECVK